MTKVCGIGLFSYLLKKICWTIYWWLCKQYIMYLRWSVRKRKAETVQSDIVGNYPR